SWPTKVILSDMDGNIFDARIDYPKGDIENPLSWEELTDRFKDHTGAVFEETGKNRIVDMVTNLQKLENVRQLTALLGN
ncbi:MAG: MmgE/PrpD family protein, partial [Deltaproteobacteria bacterium]|nr:MmgE/PrpD family protein [Deltaproteobacteria bacterium]